MMDVLEFASSVRERGRNLLPARGFSFSRPLVVLQSDDWGRAGVRDAEGFRELKASGIAMGEKPYDSYTLETAEDVGELHGLLARHHDSIGSPPRLVMNFVLANLDFERTVANGCHKLYFRLLRDGLPGKWRRPGLFESYQEGMSDGVFYPALHGWSHFCQSAVASNLKDASRRELLKTMWQADTPYIYWRMPWIGYEYWNPDPARPSPFLSGREQEDLIRQSSVAFGEFLGKAPVSACAPGYRANRDTHHAWACNGIRVAQNGCSSAQLPHLDEFGILHLYRSIDFEPAVHDDFSVEQCLALAEQCFARRLPAIISIHSINFHSSLTDFRRPALLALDEFLFALEARHPDLLYVNDADMLNIVERGRYESACGWVPVRATQSGWARSAAGVS